jgi:hypothetical protein
MAHIMPVNDLIDHKEVGDDCICGPRVEFLSGGNLIIHHSLDGRELSEEAVEKLRRWAGDGR